MYPVFLDRIAITDGRMLRKETPFGPGWDDYRVLYNLCFHQAQNFGAKVLTTI